MGDGSLLMRVGELSVAAELGIVPIYVVWMDGALAQIETKQLRQGLRPVGARLPAVSCAKIAEAFGVCGVDVDSLAAFRDALGSALRCYVKSDIGGKDEDPAPHVHPYN